MATGRSAAELRVADEHGNEIPSVVVAETAAGGWVSSFDVHFIASQDFNTWKTYWVYWSNPSATPNNYEFKQSLSKTSQHEYSPWFSRKILRGANEAALIDEARRLIPNPPSPADDEYAPVDLGFAFPYFDLATDTLYVSSNGYISLAPHSEPTNTWAEFTGNNPFGFIAPFWCNLMVNDTVPSDAGVYGRRVDANRRQRFKFTWRANRHNAVNEMYVFQAALYLRGDIALRYDTLTYNALFNTPSGSLDNPLNVAPHHTAGISATDGSNWMSITSDGFDPAITPLRDGTGNNVIHFFQSAHAWEIDPSFTDATNVTSMAGYTSVGHYDSRIFDGRSTAPTWSEVELDTSGTGMIDLYIRTSSDFNFPDWDLTHHVATDLTAGSHNFLLSVPAERYLQYRTVFKKNDPAQTPLLERIAFDVGYVMIDEVENEFHSRDVSQGQTFLATMTFSSYYSSPVDVQVASLTFSSAAVIATWSQITPMPTNIPYGASATIGFEIKIDENSGNLNSWTTLDGYVEARSGATTLLSSAAIITSRFIIREKANLVVDLVYSEFDKVNKGQGGIPVQVQLSNTSSHVPLIVNGASLTFSLGDYSWTPQYTFSPAEQGLFGQYYNTNTSNPPSFPTWPDAIRIDPQINFNNTDWPNGTSPYPPEIDENYFGIRWTGFIIPEHSEEYSIELAVRGGSRLWINDTLLIDEW